MAEELSFSNNYTDVSQQYGTGAGFQFEFYCECCRDKKHCFHRASEGDRSFFARALEFNQRNSQELGNLP